MPITLKFLLSSVLAVLASAGLYLAWLSVATTRLENLLYEQAYGHLEPKLWSNARLQAGTLANAASWDASTLDLAGRIYLLDSEFATTPKATINALRNAQRYLENAAKLRPSWPYTRLNLARVAFELDAHGPWQAQLEQALKLNLRGTFLQIDLLKFRRKLGLRLNGELARAVEQSFSQALQDSPDEMVRAALNLGRKEWACATPNNEEIEKICMNIR